MYKVDQAEPFVKWLRDLKDNRARDRITARIERAADGNFGDWKTEAGEVRAMRIDYGSGYRLYYVVRDNRVIFLLCGGDKRTQSADIQKAVEIAREI